MNDLILSWPGAARQWVEAAPVGNGRLGAMVFGGARRARWQINDSTVWSGTPSVPEEALSELLAAGAGPERLEKVRAAIRAEDYRLAERLLLTFEGRYSQEYLPFADLHVTLGGSELVYLGRSLNLDNGFVTERIEVDGQVVRRTTWASRPAGVVCVALEVEDGGVIDLDIELSSPLPVERRSATALGVDGESALAGRSATALGVDGEAGVGHRSATSLGVDGDRGVARGISTALGVDRESALTGRSAMALGVEIPIDGAPQHEPDVAEPLRFADGPVGGYDPFGAVAMAIDTDGRTVGGDGTCSISGASRVLITIASSTSGADHWHGHAPIGRDAHVRRATAIAEAATTRGESALFAEHEADLRAVLGGTSVMIGTRRGGEFDVADDVLSGKDEHLTATVITQLGRYLLASASRPGGGPPANLQGIWNDQLRPPWSSNYTININLQMNYWGAWQAGLGACDEPLVELISRLAGNGSDVARELYDARGWVAHHNTDMWGWALPVGMGHGDTSWALWMMGGVWLCQHLWDHYEFTQDAAFLRERGWPLLRGAAEFCLDWLVEGDDGLLDTIPSTSPENKFLSRHGTEESLSVSTGMDMAMICALFTRTLAAADILGFEDDVCAEIQRALPRLRAPKLTMDGRLREWSVDHREAYPTHRHMSHLVAVHPLDQIDPLTTPSLAAAAMATLDARGPGAMGWSWSWKIALRARLGQARQARSLFLEAVRPYDGDPSMDAPPDGSRWGGLLPNLFSTHPPFQIDGNYGLMAGVLEMLVQSHGGEGIRILPALPEQWGDGSCRGIGCRGGIAVDLVWVEKALSELTVHRMTGDPNQPVTVRYGGNVRTLRVALGESVRLGAGLEDA